MRLPGAITRRRSLFTPREASEPTSFQPGTRGKIVVMARRAEAGQELYHRLDPIFEWAYNPRNDSVDLLEYLKRMLQRRPKGSRKPNSPTKAADGP